METITVVPFYILKKYNPYLLDPLRAALIEVQNEIAVAAKRKLRDQDVGKKREFDKLFQKFMETYERKKIEEEDYKAKVKNTSKRSCIPNTSSTCRFTKF